MTWKAIQKINLIKLRSKSSKTYLITHVIVMFLSLFLAFTIRYAFTHGEDSPQIPSFSNNPTTNYYLFLEGFSLIPILVLSALVVHNSSQEFSLGIYKKHFIDGMSKEDLFISKIILIFNLTFFSCLISFCFSILIGLIFKNMETNQFFSQDFLWSQIVYFIKLIFILTYTYFITVMTRGSALALFILISYWVFERMLFVFCINYNFKNIIGILPFQNLSTFTTTSSLNSFIITLFTINVFILFSYLVFSKKLL